MTHAKRRSSSTTRKQRAHRVDEAKHSVADPGPTVAPGSPAGAAADVDERIDRDEFGERVHARYEDPDPRQGSADPVAVYDAMWEAGTSVMGSYVWLADHARTEDEAAKWWAAYAEVIELRERVDARDEAAQRDATAEFIARERAVRPLVTA